MARLPSALKRKEQDWSQAQQLRQENLARLDRAARGREPGNGGRQAEAARLAAPAEAPIARHLHIDTGAACLVVERRTWRGPERITTVRQVFDGSAYRLIASFDHG